MKILAVDARIAEPTVESFSVAIWSDREHDYIEDWDTWHDVAAEYGHQGYTMVAYGAEQAITRLLYTHGQHVRADYREQEFTAGKWYFSANDNPMQIWDIRPLCGALPLGELIKAVHLEPYETPQRYTWQHRARWLKPCWEHGTPACPLCVGVIHRAYWTCTEHRVGECDECWRLQNVQAVYLYMARYEQMATGYGLTPSRTLGGMAHRLWRHLDRPNPCALRTREQDDIARRGYRAGRTECFKLGHCGPVSYGDVSQMYASILRDIELPTPESTELFGQCSEWSGLPCRHGIADATIRAPNTYLPVLGVMLDQGYVFPVGTFRGHFTLAEIELAVSRGYEVLKLHQVLAGDELYKPFASFAGGMLDWREDLRRAKDPLEIVIKLMLNSLYGMIGMKAWHETEYVMPLPPETTMADWPYHDIKVLKDHVLMRRSDLRYRRGQFSNPLWAALITATARIKLYLLMERCGTELVYCDTDSIITMGEIPEDVDQPGRMRYQGWFEESAILAPKLYRLQGGRHGQRMAHAGIPRWQIERLIKEGKARVGEEYGLLDSFQTGLDAGRWVTYQTERKYSVGKRQVVNPSALTGPDGYSDTRPLVLSMEMTK